MISKVCLFLPQLPSPMSEFTKGLSFHVSRSPASTRVVQKPVSAASLVAERVRCGFEVDTGCEGVKNVSFALCLCCQMDAASLDKADALLFRAAGGGSVGDAELALRNGARLEAKDKARRGASLSKLIKPHQRCA